MAVPGPTKARWVHVKYAEVTERQEIATSIGAFVVAVPDLRPISVLVTDIDGNELGAYTLH
jgi:hypothetical protein